MHFADFAAGSIGGACGVAVGYPLDTIKVRIQTQKQFTGIWQCFMTTLSKEGVHGFFKGMFLPVTTVSMTSSVVFGTYRNCRQCLCQLRGGPGTPNTKLEIFLSGLAGGVATVTVMSPGDIVKVRLQCQTESMRTRKGANLPKPKYRGPVHCLLTIVREDGLLGLYKGALPLILRDGPSYATYFLTYSVLCDWFTPAGRKGPGKGDSGDSSRLVAYPGLNSLNVGVSSVGNCARGVWKKSGLSCQGNLDQLGVQLGINGHMKLAHTLAGTFQ
ncbi:solute carrier family 25 member 47-A isoform X3 [Esox lucius]|uniref:solute carrier family 25 member 47-A isoform X3 n=1 Tax=Esox lucius TaxID=8010 RepID=UPI001476B6E7|nr:solute carrier family 25 member 47-A isoform X3 [Esox lucius]